jgi:GNAT superfamily N-acetyltransferase
VVEVRFATPSDVSRLRSLLEELGYLASVDDVAVRLSKLANQRGGVVVAQLGTDIVGFAAYDVWFTFAEGALVCRLSALCVSEKARRSGVGKALVAEVERIAKDHGCDQIELTSGRRAERVSAHGFYPALGFEDRSGHHAFYAKLLD